MPGGPHHHLARPGLARASRWCGHPRALLRLVFWLLESSGEIGFLAYFSGFFLIVDFLHKTKHQGNSAEIRRQSVLVASKSHKFRGETIAKVFGKVDTFWMYQYVINVSIIFDAPCLFCINFLMFCLHFDVFLYIFWN